MSTIGRFDLRSCLVFNSAAILILALFVRLATRSASWRYSVALDLGQHKDGQARAVVASRVSCAVGSEGRLYGCAATYEIAVS
jgi:hypothetical protein